MNVVRAEKMPFVQNCLRRGGGMGYTVGNKFDRKINERMVFTMKKIVAMLLAVMTLCFGAAALAESVPEVDTAAEQAALTDLTANGQLIEGDGFQFYIPADWEIGELTDEDVANGYAFVACTADEKNGLVLAYVPMENEATIEMLYDEVVKEYPAASIQDLNGTSVIAYADSENDMVVIVVMDTVDPGYYAFMFTPVSDADFLPVADAIAASYTAVQ